MEKCGRFSQRHVGRLRGFATRPPGVGGLAVVAMGALPCKRTEQMSAIRTPPQRWFDANRRDDERNGRDGVGRGDFSRDVSCLADGEGHPSMGPASRAVTYRRRWCAAKFAANRRQDPVGRAQRIASRADFATVGDPPGERPED